MIQFRQHISWYQISTASVSSTVTGGSAAAPAGVTINSTAFRVANGNSNTCLPNEIRGGVNGGTVLFFDAIAPGLFATRRGTTRCKWSSAVGFRRGLIVQGSYAFAKALVLGVAFFLVRGLLCGGRHGHLARRGGHLGLGRVGGQRRRFAPSLRGQQRLVRFHAPVR